VATDVLKRAKALFGRTEPEAKPVAPKKAANPFHSVTIAPGAKCCAAAKAMRNQRFLSRTAPVLPLKGCDRDDCQCRYQHYDDRRNGQRRATDLGVSIDGYIGDERRGGVKRGRRGSDT
jgi:hypothetical protein